MLIPFDWSKVHHEIQYLGELGVRGERKQRQFNELFNLMTDNRHFGCVYAPLKWVMVYFGVYIWYLIVG